VSPPAKLDTASYRQRAQAAKAQRYAGRFDRGARKRINAREQRAVRRIFDQLENCRRVVDVPCGASRFLATLRADGRQVLEVDVAHEMLTVGRQRHAGHSWYLQADATCLPLPDGAVDCVFCNRLLHHIVDAGERASLLREFGRVTRRYVVVSFFDYQAFGPVRRLLKRLKGRRPRYEGQPTLRQFRAEVEGCGFVVRQVQRLGPFWVAQKFFVLEIHRRPGGPAR
jgi:ubiquinone/menaquinone biosynthesis C-methylase UbiE